MNKYDKKSYYLESVLQKCSDLCPKVDDEWLVGNGNRNDGNFSIPFDHSTVSREYMAHYDEGW